MARRDRRRTSYLRHSDITRACREDVRQSCRVANNSAAMGVTSWADSIGLFWETQGSLEARAQGSDVRVGARRDPVLLLPLFLANLLVPLSPLFPLRSLSLSLSFPPLVLLCATGAKRTGPRSMRQSYVEDDFILFAA